MFNIFFKRQRIIETCELIQTLAEMYQLSYKMFLNSLNIHATRLLDKVGFKFYFKMFFFNYFVIKVEPPNFELLPNEEFRQTLTLIKDIFDSYNNSVVSVNTKKDDYIQVIWLLNFSL